jgi:NDP-sugar pyrophosphorylase family protein
MSDPMKAMILAAGLGTRLRPLTDDRPKALVTVAGRTMLEIALARLRSFGVGEVIVNTHHFAEKISEYLAAKANFGMHIEISHEEELLDTGGGLKKAAWFFLDDKRPEDPGLAPFILHNVDVISTIDLGRMVGFHNEQGALATLAVQERETSRYLLFDKQLRLCGRLSGHDQQAEFVQSSEQLYAEALAFSGVHVISPRIFGMMTEEGPFSIITSYLRIAGGKEKIVAFRGDEYYWRDLGRPENVALAGKDFEDKILS